MSMVSTASYVVYDRDEFGAPFAIYVGAKEAPLGRLAGFVPSC